MHFTRHTTSRLSRFVRAPAIVLITVALAGEVSHAEEREGVVEIVPIDGCAIVNPLAPPPCIPWSSSQERPGEPY